MSTRSLTRIYDDDGHRLVTFYRQSDGYVSGHGHDLAGLLSGMQLVNGIGVTKGSEKIANGMGCLAAQIVAHFKNEFGVGGIYLERPDIETKGWGAQYCYEVGLYHDALQITVFSGKKWKVIFTGSPEDLLKFEEKEE